MKQIRLKLCIAILLGVNGSAFACTVCGDSPQNYNIYRVCEKPLTSSPILYYAPNYKQQNLEAWAEESYFKGDLYDIEKVVYRYSLDELLELRASGNLPDWDKNNRWADWCHPQHLYAHYLVIAKQCEIARAEQSNPWYYPADKQHGFTTLDALLAHLSAVEDTLRKNTFDGSLPLEDRFNLQRTRILFSLGKYHECVRLWKDYASRLPESNVMRYMIKDYVAGAYCHLGDTATAKRMYLEQGNYWEVARLSHESDNCWAYAIKAIYDVEPDCADMVAYNMQADLEHYCSWLEMDPKMLKKYYDVMCYITRTGRSRDMAIWYYTKAYVEDKLGYYSAAVNSIATAERCKTSDYMHRNIRLFRIYMNAKTQPINNAYEDMLCKELCWIDTLIKNNLTTDIRSLLIKEENDAYPWHKMWYCYSFYYYNDIMRKIIIGEAAPRLMAAGRKTRAVQLYNYADNMLFKQVVPRASHCFLNYFFGSLYQECSGKEIEAYIERVKHPISKFDRLLGSGSYLDMDYLYDIAGTVYLREQNYSKALECLSKVSNTYQERLHTAGYMNNDPFCADMYAGSMWGEYPFTDYKYNFAREMCSLEQVMNDKRIDINRRASAKLRYAIGLRNSYFRSWPLTQYSQGIVSFAHSSSEWMNSEREDAVLRRYKVLQNEAFAMFDDDEAAAAAHYKFKNNRTVVRQYPKTQTAAYIREHCDTYYDYHMDRARKYYDEPFTCQLYWHGRHIK